MLKRTWMILLAVTLVFGLVGCMDVKEASQKEWKTVFDMATDERIQAIQIGSITLAADGEPSPLAPLQNAGGASAVTFTAVAGPSTQAVSLQFESIATWGAGLDLPFKSFAFAEEDEITIKGTIIAVPASGVVQLNSRVGNERAIGDTFDNEDEGEAFEIKVTLTADDVGFIRGGSPAGLRLEGRGVAGVKVKIDNIKIEGWREVKALKAPVITLTEDILSWAEIEGAAGYEIYANDVKVAETGNTSFDLSTLIGDGLESEGTYTIYVIAIGIEGASLDSKKSNTRTYVAPEVLDIYDVPEGGEDFFYVNLNNYKTPVNSATFNGAVPVGVLTEDSITLTFNAQNQPVVFGFSTAQIEMLKTGGSVNVVIDGTADTSNDFRYTIGSAAAGSNWNGTNMPGPAALNTILSETLTYNDNFYSDDEGHDRAACFIFQMRNSAAETVVEITSIKITVVPATVTVDVDGSNQTVDLIVKNGIIQKTDNGYIFTRTAAWENSYVFFKLDLGADSIDQFATMTFDYTGISGDIGWKDLKVIASDEAFEGQLDDGAENMISDGRVHQINGTTETAITATIEEESGGALNAATLALDGNVYFSIFFNARKDASDSDPTPTKFKIENIKLNK